MRTLSTITPTSEQLAILADSRPGFWLIRGAAGSGKTTTALLRLRQLCASRISRQDRLGSEEPIRVLVLTFNRTLQGYVEQLAEEQIASVNRVHLTIETFGRWALNLVGQRTIIDPQEYRRSIVELLRSAGIVAEMDYFIDEIEYVMGRFSTNERRIYRRALRMGRGRAPAVPRTLRTILLDKVIRPYEAMKSKKGLVDWHDITLEAAAATGFGYDVVVVDECQDFSANQLRAILAHLKEDHVTTFIIDAVQRIYPQSFQWREIGIEMRPQMVSTLAQNHRNTVEITRFASSLVRNLPSEEDGIIPNAEACSEAGPLPDVVAGIYSEQIDYMLNRVQPYLDAGETVAILQPKGGGWFNFAKNALRERNIRYCELTRNRDWPTGPEQVALSTIHSAKGLEFDHVLLPGLNREVTPHGDEEGDGTLDSLRRLVAMGIGRARSSVIVGYKPGEQSTLIDLFDPSTYNLIEV